MKGDKRHGYGTYTWSDDGCFYTGKWENDKMHGKGKMTFKNGNAYEGEFYKNNMHGIGSLTTASGEEIKGAFVFKRRFVTTKGNRYPVGEYSLDVDIIAKDLRSHEYRGAATIHLFTGLLVLPNMQDPNPDTSIYEAALVVDPISDKDSPVVAIAEAKAVEDEPVNFATFQPLTKKTEGTGIKFGEQDESYNQEVRRKHDPNNWTFF